MSCATDDEKFKLTDHFNGDNFARVIMLPEDHFISHSSHKGPRS